MAVLENMQVFVRVVELGSFSAAGRHLRLSPAVVSHRIQQLENHVGARLLNRTTRQLQMTEEGEVFFEECREVLRAVERAESSIAAAGGAPRGHLRVTAPVGFGRRVVAPLVPAFRARFPHVEVRLGLTDRMVDLLQDGVDVAIRMAVLQDSSLTVRKIADCPRILCAAPSYLAAQGTPAAPEDLLRHHCLMLRFPGSQQFQWTLNGPDGRVKLAVSGAMDSDDGDVLTRWALDGFGIVMKPVWEIAAHLRTGALHQILPDHLPEPVTLAALYPHRRFLAAKVRAFTDFVAEHGGAALADAPVSGAAFSRA